VPALRIDHFLLGILLINLVVVGAIAIKQLGVTQAPQVVSIVVALAIGLSLGISWARTWHGAVRAAIITLGIAAAVAAWWFVPTLAGINRWTAEHETRRLVAELGTIPVGDGVKFAANVDARQKLIDEFPEFAARFEEPSKAWESASLAEWTRKLDEAAPGDIAAITALREAYKGFEHVVELEEAELVWFSGTYSEMKPGDIAAAQAVRAAAREHPYWSKQINTWEDAWAMRTVTDAVAETDRFVATDPIRASVRLHQLAEELSSLSPHDKPQAKLASARRNAFQASLAATQRKALDLARREKYQEADAATRDLDKHLRSEATALGLESELARIVDSYGFLADLAKQAGKSDPR
jgi:hypothetical protein